MKKIKVIKKGFSLIEILLFLGMILFLTVSAFLIYNKLDTAIYAKKINDDIKYSYSFYKNTTEGKSPYANFPSKNGCCDLTPAIDSNFIKINKKSTWGKYYSSPKKDEIEIIAHATWNNDADVIFFDTFSYDIYGNISPELCSSIVSANIKNEKLIYVYIKGKKNAIRIASKPDKYQSALIIKSVSDIPKYCEHGAIQVGFLLED